MLNVNLYFFFGGCSITASVLTGNRQTEAEPSALAMVLQRGMP